MNTIILYCFLKSELGNYEKLNTKINSKLNIVPKLTKDLTHQARVSDVIQQRIILKDQNLYALKN
jgi:hypothetical protein